METIESFEGGQSEKKIDYITHSKQRAGITPVSTA